MTRRIAVLSDVHGHLQALEAVLADAQAAGATEIVVAGDIVNFGPSSAEVVDLLRERGAQMIRGNHEVELVAPYGTPAMPAEHKGPRFIVARWVMESLGPERRAFLTALPDRLWLDEVTVVAHGSPRHVRDAVSAAKSDEELAAMWTDEVAAARVAFVGHTHRTLVRDLPAVNGTPARRFVNAGSAGLSLEGEVVATYVLAEQGRSGAPGDWEVEIRRVAYDLEATIAAFDRGMRQACPEVAELLIRQLRTGRSYFGPWVRMIQSLPEEEAIPAARRFLAEHP
jgi:predicted phosphodiesterase